MKHRLFLIILFTNFSLAADHASFTKKINEVVYVESPTDTDNDGKKDLIYVSIKRPIFNSNKLSTMLKMSPYSLGGNSTTSHNVDVDILPQDKLVSYNYFMGSLNTFFKRDNQSRNLLTKYSNTETSQIKKSRIQYAKLSAHSLGTGYSTGCPTVGDRSEALAGKAVID